MGGSPGGAGSISGLAGFFLRHRQAAVVSQLVPIQKPSCLLGCERYFFPVFGGSFLLSRLRSKWEVLVLFIIVSRACPRQFSTRNLALELFQFVTQFLVFTSHPARAKL